MKMTGFVVPSNMAANPCNSCESAALLPGVNRQVFPYRPGSNAAKVFANVCTSPGQRADT
jgi:hypothetical protein